MKRIQEEGDLPTIDPKNSSKGGNEDSLEANSLAPPDHLKSDDPEQPDILLRRAGDFSGEVFGVRCEFGPVNKFIPMKPLILPEDPLMLEDVPAGSMTDTIPLIRRGGGKFVDKAFRAQQ